jgi:hypothetical protein
MLLTRKSLAGAGIAFMLITVVAGAIIGGPPGPLLLGIRLEFFLFALTLLAAIRSSRDTAEVSARRLEGRLRAARHGVRAWSPGRELLQWSLSWQAP